MRIKFYVWTALMTLLPTAAMAAEGPDTGDTAWIIVSTALVMMMTPAGLALFYGGLSRYKNLLNTIAMTMVAYCLGSIIWVMWGYTLAFGPSQAGLVGGLDYLFLNGIGVDSLSGSIPTYVFLLFQMTFAGITVALVLGSIVDRMKFSSWVVFTILWLTFIYSPVAHWAWGGGWMGEMGALDFAGGTVVHINAGVAGLVLALVLLRRAGGPRRDCRRPAQRPRGGPDGARPPARLCRRRARPGRPRSRPGAAAAAPCCPARARARRAFAGHRAACRPAPCGCAGSPGSR